MKLTKDELKVLEDAMDALRATHLHHVKTYASSGNSVWEQPGAGLLYCDCDHARAYTKLEKLIRSCYGF